MYPVFNSIDSGNNLSLKYNEVFDVFVDSTIFYDADTLDNSTILYTILHEEEELPEWIFFEDNYRIYGTSNMELDEIRQA